MGLDDSCDSALILGLSIAPSNNYFNHGVKKPSPVNLEPSLTLSLPGGSYNKKKSEEFSSPAAGGDQLCRQASSLSGVSSFSTGRAKREREMKKEDEEEDEDGVSTRKKLRLNKEQSAVLEQSFKQHSILNPTQKQALSKQLNLRPRQVEVWFQNRRARTKLKQTETDCEFLKKCCETLTDENRRLQKEVQELKTLKMTHIPFYKHLPAATLTMCPSCERIGAGAGAGAGAEAEAAASKIPFSLAAAAAAKPYFYNPFSNPSAAC